MAQVTVLLHDRGRFVVIELRALGDGSAELHRRWGRVGGSAAGHVVDTCCTVQLARGARLELLKRLRRRGYERVFGVEGAPAGWKGVLGQALDRARSRARPEGIIPVSGQLELPLAG